MGCASNVHFHTVALDGVFSVASGKAVFYQLPGPSAEEVADIIAAVTHVVIQDLRQQDTGDDIADVVVGADGFNTPNYQNAGAIYIWPVIPITES